MQNKDEIQKAIVELETAIANPAIPEEVKNTLIPALERAKTQLLEFEKDPHGQRRLVTDMHDLMLTFRDHVDEIKGFTGHAVNNITVRQCAERGAIIEAGDFAISDEGPAEDVLIFDYHPVYFSYYAGVASLFKKIIDQPGAISMKALIIVVAKDTDALLEICYGDTEISAKEFERAAGIGTRIAYFFNPMITGIVGFADASAFYPSYVGNLLTKLASRCSGMPSFEKGGKIGDGKLPMPAKDTPAWNYLQILKDLIAHPRKYDNVVNVPGAKDAKEILDQYGIKYKGKAKEEKSEEVSGSLLYWKATFSEAKTVAQLNKLYKEHADETVKLDPAEMIELDQYVEDLAGRLSEQDEIAIATHLIKMGIVGVEHNSASHSISIPNKQLTAPKVKKINAYLDKNGYKPKITKFSDVTTLQFTFEKGGVTFDDKVEAIADKLEGTAVPKQYQAQYGKKYSAKDARSAAERITGAIEKGKKKKGKKKMLFGGMINIQAPDNLANAHSGDASIYQ